MFLFPDRNILILLVALVLIVSCGKQREKVEEITYEEYKKPLLRVNKILVQKDDEIIDAFVELRNWEMTKTKTGLRYMIYKEGSGVKVGKGKYVSFDYNIGLLDGTVCYSSDSLGAKTVHFGKEEIPLGVEEALGYCHAGDRIRCILPPHLAFGVSGDGGKIPTRAIVIYDLEVLNVKSVAESF